ncbi:MAG: hypothetical protein KF900_04080 [Bacteroidetes bacterium]|nr:hypothetical protein [Bacteroidota bacterium]
MTLGIVGVKPQILKAKVIGSKLFVKFEDGRELYTPKKLFPFLKGRLGKIFIADGETIIFDNADEVIHVSELLGRYEDYKYSFV